MSDWSPGGAGGAGSSIKRRAEHTLQVPSTKRQHQGDVKPGWEYVEPRVYQQPNYSDEPQSHQGTNFSTWSEADIKAFLDERGGDFDDCTTFEQLVERAVETEVNTGPARRPAGAEQPAAAGTGNGVPPPPTAAGAAPAAADGAADDEEYDPLEAFMAEVNQEVAANKPNKPAAAQEVQQCDDVADPAAEYMEVRAARGKASAAAIAADVAAEGYDSDEEVYATAKALAAEGAEGQEEDLAAKLAQKRNIDPLAPVDHSLIEYDDFAKDFYTEHPSITALSDQQVREMRRELDIHVSGFDPPRPVKTFGQAGFDHLLLGAIKKAGYEAPTAIQAQALPAALSGRDVLGLAKTGSGKTAAFVLPMLVHIMDQPELDKGAGPIGLVLAPTRELAEQIHKEARKFSKPYGLRCVAAFGGLSKFEQFKELKAGAEIAIATPGRMMDLIRMKACNTLRITYLVLDEADRMFDMGFGEQVHSLLNVVRPDRQTLLFSATLPRKIESLVAEALSNPVRISVGLLGAANADVSQRVEVLKDDVAKLSWLRERLPGFIDEGDVLCFVGQRAKAEEVTQALQDAGFKAAAIHGDMDQFTRMKVLESFRSGQQHLLVATDVAARGLDIKSIKTVINYDAARDIDTHIHRVGRTGRAGDKEGVAITLLLANKDAHFAGLLVNSLSLGGQEVPRDLHALAMKDNRFKRGSSRHKGGRGGKGGGGRRKGPAMGGAGLGFGNNGPFIPQSSAEAAAATAAAGAGGAGAGGGGIPQGMMGGGGSTAAVHAGGGGSSGGFVQLAGFAKSTDDYEHESSAAATAPTHQHHHQQHPRGTGSAPPFPAAAGSFEGFNFPPPPPDEDEQPPLPPEQEPPAAPAAPAAAVAAVQQQPPTPAEQQQQQQPPAAPVPAAAPAAPAPPPPSSMAAARQEMLQAGYAQHMKRGFVSSGVRGGDVGESATIVAPRVPKSSSTTTSCTVVPPSGVAVTAAPAAAAAAAAVVAAPVTAGGRPVPRPPIPVTQRPMYLTRPTETIARGPRRPPAAAAAASPAVNSTAAQQAIAAAQAIAQRLAAQAVGVPQGAAGVGAGGISSSAGGMAAATPSYGSSAYSPYPVAPQQQQQQPYYQQGAAVTQQQQQQEYDPFQQYSAPAAAAAAPQQQQPPWQQSGWQQQQQQPGPGTGAYDPVAAAQAVAARLAQQHPHR